MGYGTENHQHDSHDVYGVAGEHHRHYDLERDTEGVRDDLNSLRYRVSDLEERLSNASAEIDELRAEAGRTP